MVKEERTSIRSGKMLHNHSVLLKLNVLVTDLSELDTKAKEEFDGYGIPVALIKIGEPQAEFERVQAGAQQTLIPLLELILPLQRQVHLDKARAEHHHGAQVEVLVIDGREYTVAGMKHPKRA